METLSSPQHFRGPAFSLQPSPSTDAPKGHPASSWLNQGPLVPSSSPMPSVETPRSSRYWGAACARGPREAVSPPPCCHDGASDGDTLSCFPATPKPGRTLPTGGTAHRKQAPCFTLQMHVCPRPAGGEPGRLGGIWPHARSGPQGALSTDSCLIERMVSRTPH